MTLRNWKALVSLVRALLLAGGLWAFGAPGWAIFGLALLMFWVPAEDVQ